MNFEELMAYAKKTDCSDIHITVGTNLALRRYGTLEILPDCPTAEESRNMIFAFLDQKQVELVTSGEDLDVGCMLRDGTRIRANIYHQRNNLAASIRLLKQEIPTFSQLGLPDVVRELSEMPRGLVLVTGPTGSGKSTTLYTALSELNREEVNIVTVEDPVEADIEGINQIQVNNKVDLTFASALRSILRQDPDIIMIGEIRDQETAGIAVQASITGHLVVSTLHTNNAVGTLNRMADMGVERYLIADSVVGVIAQRLVRKLCPHCRKMRPASEEEKRILRQNTDQEVNIYEPAGCKLCNNTGFFGRIGVFEIMEVNEEIRNLIAENGTTEELEEAAKRSGMRTLRQNGIRYVLDGTTSIEEMLKASYE